MSEYKKMLGFNTPKKQSKSKSKVNEVLKSLQEEFGEINENPALARAAMSLGKAAAAGAGQGFGDKMADKVSKKVGLDKDEDKEEVKEGPAYEYKKDIKNIDKSYKLHAKSVLNFYEKLRKKGLDKEASDLLDTYKKNYVTFKKQYDKIISKLL